MKKRIFVALGGISLLGGLLTAATTANAANDPLPGGPWSPCATATSFFCIESVSVDDGFGTTAELKWVASGTVNPWLAPAAPVAAPAASPAAATTDANAAPAASPAAAAPAPVPAPIVAPEVETTAGTVATTGRWTSDNWNSARFGVKGYDGIFVNARPTFANSSNLWTTIDPVFVNPTDSKTSKALDKASGKNANLDTNTRFTIKIRVKDTYQPNITLGAGAGMTVKTADATGYRVMTLTGKPVVVPFVTDSKQCQGETGKASSKYATVQAISFTEFGIDGVSNDIIVLSDGLCKLSSPVWNANEKSFVFTAAAPHFDVDGTTVNRGFYRAYIPFNDAKVLWGLANPNDAAKALELSVTTEEATGEQVVSSANIAAKNGVISIEYEGFSYSQPKLAVKMKKGYKPTAAAAVKTPAKKTITCVKGKITKKVTTAACPAGFKKK
ncbi:MAG: hypothetical protein EBX92_03815 [Actinobacteria bacterium]|nr:hypothetical protein [Actinomycetota bacterium]